MTKKIGRFEVIRELGRGAQSVVYLAFDPQLEREVAVKTLHFSRPDPQQNAALLAEARMVSKLRHPGIVPIYEAGEEGGDVFLVFEYVPGENLALHLRRQGALPAARAAGLMTSILAAIAHAHGHGIIHRDLKPSNILMDETGVPRVMDFGIATHVAGASADQQEFTGTPAYMAPEYIARRIISEQTDIFAAGLILFEMVTGRRAIQGENIYQIMNQISNESVKLPGDGSVVIDDRIGDILLKATARLPDQRYQTAAQFLQALETYLAPEEEGAGSGGGKQSTVDFLLRRLRHKGDFPALSESVSAINKIASSETESISKLSSSILKDFSLTNKILRLVNSAHFRQAGGGNISTVSRAVIVLGFDAVRNIAVTVLLFEHLQNKANAKQLKEEFLRANMAGLLAKGIALRQQGRGEQEQPFICAMFHNLGRLLSQYYLAEESEEIRKLMLQKEVSEEVAALQVLGVSFEDLGIGIARSWGFPGLIINSMRRLPAGQVRKPVTADDRMQVLSAFSNQICDVLANATPEEREKELRKVSGRFGASVPLNEQELKDTISTAVDEINEFARIIRVNLQQTQFGRQLKRLGTTGSSTSETEEAEATETPGGSTGALGGAVLGAENPLGLDTGSFGEEGQKSADAQAILTAGIQDISNSLVEGFKLNDILRIILETMYRAMGFKRVILCIKDARHNVMQGRFGFGPEAAELAKQFRFTLSFTPDIFHAATSKGVDILISDIDDPKIASRIPDWYRKIVPSKTFVVLPLNIKTNPVALIYADRDEAGSIEITEKELSLLRTLRNQAVLAIKQVG